MTQDEIFNAKVASANAAISMVENNMLVGLGSGSTAEIFVEMLAARKLDIKCVASSNKIAALAQKFGLQVVDNSSWQDIDLTIDGADEIDPKLNLIKGLGAALLREKIIIGFSKRVVIISDSSKKVQQLGEKAPVPVEVPAFGLFATRYQLSALVGDVDDVRLRSNEAGKIIQTDGGNHIYDCFFGRISDPKKLANTLDQAPFILAHGLFLEMAHEALIADSRGNIEHVKF